MTAIFITATGTDIGKTFVAAGLIRFLRARGQKVDALKPVISGFNPAQAGTSDCGVLLRALGLPLTDEEIEDISPWRFKAPLSPDMAAKHENVAIDFEQIVSFSETAIAESEGALVIEGVGGVMAPLDDTHTVLDWIGALDVPSILVAGSYLGSLSHTLSAAAMLNNEGCDLRAIVVSESAGSHVPLYETVATLGRFEEFAELITLPRIAEYDEHPAFEQIAKSCGLI